MLSCLVSEAREARGIGLGGGKAAGHRELMKPFEAAERQQPVRLLFIKIGQKSERAGFAGGVSQLDEMLAGIIQATLSLPWPTGSQKGLAELSICHGQPFLIPHGPVKFQCLLEGLDGGVVVPDRGVLQGEVGIEDSQGPLILRRVEQIAGFEVVGTGTVGPARVGVEVPEVREGLPDGRAVLPRALKIERFPVVAFRRFTVAEHGADVAEITQGVRERPLISAGTILGDGLLIAPACLNEITAMKENPPALCRVSGHGRCMQRESLNS